MKATGITVCRLLVAVLLAATALPTARPAAPPATAPGSAAAGEPATRPAYSEIKLRHVLWQALPAQVREAYAAPDGKVWYLVGEPYQAVELALVKATIEREWPKMAPQIVGARVALFETKGEKGGVVRVWCTAAGKLLGYAGTPGSWIERSAEGTASNCTFYSVPPPRHGRETWRSSGPNLQLGGRLFFPDCRGVHVYDGRDWSYKAFIAPSIYTAIIPLLPEADGKGLVAVCLGWPPSVWRYRDGQWANVPLPDFLAQTSEFQPAGPTADGRLLLGHRGDHGYLVCPLQLEGYDRDLKGEFAEQLKKLGHDRFNEREQASSAILDLGPQAKPLAEAALAQALDAEVHWRLELILGELKESKPRPLTLGAFTVQEFRGLVSDDWGNLMVTADSIREGAGAAEPGTILLPRNGAAVRLDGVEPPCSRLWGQARVPVLAAGGKKGWMAAQSRGGFAATTDPATRPALGRWPDENYPWVQDVAADGTVFASADQWVGGGLLPVMACKPGAPDDRKIVNARGYELAWDCFCVASDGAVWAPLRDQGLSRFDGKAWVKAAGFGGRSGYVQWLIPGTDGSMFTQSDQGYVLVKKDGSVVGPDSDFERLVAAHKKDFVAAFSGPVRADSINQPNHEFGGIVADKAGNIWGTPAWGLRVLVGEQWQDPTFASDADKAPERYQLNFLASVGDGSKVFVCARQYRREGATTYLGGVNKEGQVVLTSVEGARPTRFSRNHLFAVPLDGQGGRWLADCGQDINHDDWGRLSEPETAAAQRWTEKGLVESCKGIGWPRLADKAGAVWIGPVLHYTLPAHQSVGRYIVWSKGRLGEQVFIPAAFPTSPIFSDQPGSIWVWTILGLQQYVAADMTDRAAPKGYALKATFHVDSPQGAVFRFEDNHWGDCDYSDLGYVVTVRQDYRPGWQSAKSFLHLVPLLGGPADGIEPPATPGSPQAPATSGAPDR